MRRPVLSVATLLAAALSILHPLIRGRVLGGHVLGTPPFEATTGPRAQGDLEVQPLPFACHVHRELRAGRIPLWNPFAGAGAPFLANQTSAVLHPFTILAVLFPWRFDLSVCAALRLGLAFVGAWLLGRDLGLGFGGSAAAACAFATSGSLVAFLANSLGGVLAHLPMLCYLARAAARRRGGWPSIALAGCLGSTLLAGHPEYVPVLWLAAVVAFATARPRPASILALPLVFAAGAALGAVTALPGAEYIAQSPHFHRRLSWTAVLFSDPLLLKSAIHPTLLRQPRQADLAAGGYDPVLVAVSYVGLPVVLLALIGLSRRRGRMLAGWLAGTLLLLVAHPLSRAVWSVPPLRLMGAGRLLVIPALFLSLMAGVGLDAVLGRLARGRSVLAACALAGILADHGFALGQITPWSVPAAIYPDRPLLRAAQSLAGGDRVVGIGHILFPNGATVYGMRDLRCYDAINVDGQAAAMGLADDIFQLLWRSGSSAREAAARVLLLPPAAVVESPRAPGLHHEIRARAGTLHALDVEVDPERQCPIYPLLARLTMGRRRPVAWEAVIEAPAPDRPRLRLDPPLFEADAGLTVIIDLLPMGTDTGPEPVALRAAFGDPAQALVLREEGGVRLALDPFAPPRARIESAPLDRSAVTYQEDGPQRVALDVHARSSDSLVLADTAFPGWIATVDGAPARIERRGPFRSVEVSAGDHRVVFEYRPTSYQLGAFASAMALMALALVAPARRRPQPSL